VSRRTKKRLGNDLPVIRLEPAPVKTKAGDPVLDAIADATGGLAVGVYTGSA
jgi:hypothetical protein